VQRYSRCGFGMSPSCWTSVSQAGHLQGMAGIVDGTKSAIQPVDLVKLSSMQSKDIVVRREGADDTSAVRAVNETAFGRTDEAELVDRLRNEGAVLASFVAEQDGRITGHILFSRTLIETADDSVPSVALAPMAVSPPHQRRGIGSQLVRFGLQSLLTRGERSVLVLGHPHFYQQFGFSTDRARTLATPFPPHAFMALELVTGALDGVRGGVRYPAAFGL
jgi:putative acetyltransferase